MMSIMKYLRLVTVVVVGLYGFYLTAVNSQSNALVLGSEGTILVAGFANNSTNQSTDFSFVRYLPDGSLDTSFNAIGPVGGLLRIDLQGNDDGVNGVVLDDDNKIIFAGFSGSGLATDIAVGRLNNDGSLDETFNANGLFPGAALITLGPLVDFASAVAIDSQGRIVVAGSSDNGQTLDFVVVRLTSSGELDLTFNAQSARPGIFTRTILQRDVFVSAVALNPDDSIVVGGSNDTGVNTNFLIVKLTEDGVLDTSFNVQSTTPGIVQQNFREFDDRAFTLQIDNQQRIVIGGFSSNGPQMDFALARYTAAGILDETFNAAGTQEGLPGTVITSVSGSDDVIQGLTLTEDDKIVVTGFVDDGLNRSFASARYNEDGSLDKTFNPTAEQAGIVITSVEPTDLVVGEAATRIFNEGRAIATDKDNKIFVAGFSFGGLQNNVTTINYLEDGQLNPDFNQEGLISQESGIVITPFGESLTSLGNGTPLIVYDDVSGVSSSILDSILYPPEPTNPVIDGPTTQITNDMQPTLTGFASPNAVITIYVNDVSVGSTFASYTGEWYMTLPFLLDGTYKITSISMDPLSGVTLASLPIDLTIKTDSPPAPTIETPKSNERITQESVLVSGQSEPETLVTLFLDDKELDAVEADSAGRWTLQTDLLASGSYSLTAQALDTFGNLSALSPAVRFSLNTGSERAPTISFPQPGMVSSERDLLIQGGGKPGSPVTLFLNNKLTGTVPVDQQGKWSHKLESLKNGTYEVYVSGAQGSTSEKVRFTIKGLEVPVNDQQNPTPGAKGQITGRAAPDSRVALYAGTRYLGSTTTDSQGIWSYLPTVSLEDALSFKVIVTDKEGNRTVLEQQP